jgi:hypothetical protein
LLAIFPVFFIPVLLGGTTWGEVVRVLVSLLVALLFSLSLGLFFSAVGEESRVTVFGTFITLVLFLTLPVLFQAVLHDFFRIKGVGAVPLSPGALLLFAYEDNHKFGSGAKIYWDSVVLLTFLGGLALWLACALLPSRVSRRVLEGVDTRRASGITSESGPLPQDGASARFSQEQGGSMQHEPRMWERLWGGWFVGREPMKPLRRKLLSGHEPHPYEWRVRRLGRGSRLVRVVYIGATLLFGLSLCASVTTRHEEFWFISAFCAAFGLHLATKVLMALEATRWFHDDKRSGALEVLLVTPVKEADIVRDHLCALRYLFRRPKWLLFALNCALIFTAINWSDHLHLGNEEAWIFHALFFGGILAAWVDLKTICWMGLRYGMTCATHLRALLQVLLLLMVPPWLLLGAFLLLAEAVVPFRNRDLGVALVFWFIGSAAYASALLFWSRWKLRHRFRAMASGLAPNKLAGGAQP